MNIQRRSFLTGSALLATSAVLPKVSEAKVQGVVEAKNKSIELPPSNGGRASEKAKKLVLGEPFLQAPGTTSMGIAWTVNCLANGWVDVSESPDLSNAKRFICGGYGVTGFDDKIIQVRITDLKPNTKYYYRIGAEHIDYVGNYKRYRLDKAQGPIHSFTTFGEKIASHFCVMNDTHAKWEQFGLTTSKIRELNPSAIVWNGDATNQTEDEQTAIDIFLAPKIPHPGYASEIPLLWVNGNHDFRGIALRNMSRFVMPHLPTERSARDWQLGRNFAVRVGDIAMIGLDTGEDKPDEHPQFCGLVSCNEYRIAQGEWLKDQFKRPEIANAPYIVAFCHIPIYDSNPLANPGDILEGYASWQRTCNRHWGPTLTKYGAQLVVAAHMHKYRYDAPGEDRSWAQVVGGGLVLDPKSEKVNISAPTVIEGKVENGELVVRVHNIALNKVMATHKFKPRKV
jgi:hypothetical protein